MTLGVNDYPYPTGGCTLEDDPWGCTMHQCTSFGAWRIVNDAKRDFHCWGNATAWPDAARAAGFAVDGNPYTPGLITLAQLSPGNHPEGIVVGGDGHIAVVLGPSGADNCWVEDYNWDYCCCYHQHALPISGTQFIHIPIEGATTPPPSTPPPTMPTPTPVSPLSDDVILGGLLLLAAGGGLAMWGARRKGIRPEIDDRGGRHGFGTGTVRVAHDKQTPSRGPSLLRPRDRAFE